MQSVNLFINFNFDDAFMCHSHASEVWLAMFLSRVKERNLIEWDEDLEVQLQDEKRHALMFKSVIKKFAKFEQYKIETSIQEAIYESLGGYDFSKIKTRSELNAVLFKIERRALFLYKMFLRVSRCDAYKDTVRTVVQDELRHSGVARLEVCDRTMRDLEKVEIKVFGEYLPKKYGVENRYSVFLNLNYWRDLFSGSLSVTY